MDPLENKETLAAPEQVADVNEQEVENNAQAAQTEAEVEAEAETGAEVETEVEAETEAEPEVEVEAEAEPEVGVGDDNVTREQLVEEFTALLQQPVDQIKERADQIKSQFYRLHHIAVAKRKEMQQAAAEAADDAEAVAADVAQQADEKIDNVEAEFKKLLQQYKDMRAEANKKQQQQLEQNQLRKENIIAQMKEMVESGMADVQDNMKKFRDLQAEWKTIGAVPPTVATQLWKQYNYYQEQFYDLVKINYDLRDYDFKKNLDIKNQLCEQAEQLKNNPNVVEAFRALQQLHSKWAEVGPVARELREEVWNRFKEASTVINKRHQEHFEQIHQQEEQNLQVKLDIIEQLKSIDYEQLTTNKQWDEATQKVTELQSQWRAVGFAPKKHNQVIYDEYRALCDEFFAKKTAFYKSLKDMLSDNLQKKRSLLSRAEELKDSEQWAETTEKLVQLQAEWKKIGPVARKYSDDIWKRFQAACDEFFQRKKEQNRSTKDIEKANLEAKKAIIKQIEELEVTTKKETLQRLSELSEQYAAIGHVPYKDKEKIYKQMRAACDRIYDQLDVQASERRLGSFSHDIESKDDNQLQNERRRLVRQFENLEQEIKVAENNILFFTSKSGKGNKIVSDMQKKIEDLKRQLAEVEKKVNIIDSKLSEE